MSSRPIPLFAKDTTAAKLLDMEAPKFRALVASGALPGPVVVDDEERWDVGQICDVMSGKAARPGEDFEL